MNTTEHEDLIKDLISSYCLLSTELSFVDSVRDWCKDNDIEEPDREKPMRFIIQNDKACKLVVKDILLRKEVEKRLNALRVRSALVNVANNRADMLDSDRKKLAYLILNEYASTVQTPDDELLADQWVFDELERKGLFNE